MLTMLPPSRFTPFRPTNAREEPNKGLCTIDEGLEYQDWLQPWMQLPHLVITEDDKPDSSTTTWTTNGKTALERPQK